MQNVVSALLFALCLLCLAVSLRAQTAETQIDISVKNQLGEMVADAEVTLSKSGNIVQKSQVKRRQGTAQFAGLVAGEYRVTVTAPGFNEYKSDLFYLGKGETKKLDITLEIASIESVVVIGDQDEADAERYGTTRDLTTQQIANLPDKSGEIERVLRSMAGESVTGGKMPISVDGVTGSPIPPRQAIQQVRVNQNIFSAQYEGPTGGGIEIFTRSNIDKYNGSLSFNFADSHLNARDSFTGRRIPFQARHYAFNLGGPLGKKTSFFSSLTRSENEASSVISAIVLDSALEPVELNETFERPGVVNNWNLIINSDVTKKHKLTLFYYTAYTFGKGQNTGGFALPSRANNYTNQYHFLTLTDTFLANPNMVSQTRLSGDYTIYRNFGGSSDPAINVLEAFSGGGSQSDFSNKTFNFRFSNDTTRQFGRYGVGFGFIFRGQLIDQTSRTNFGGTYTFGGRQAPRLDINNAPVIDGNGGFMMTQINSLESYRRTLLFSSLGYSETRIRELGGGANQLALSGGNPNISAHQYEYGLYLQNNYKFSQALALSFGFRYENQTNIASHFNLSPRFGLIWSPKTDEKKNPLFSLPRISAGFGIFYSRFGLSNILNNRLANDTDRSQYLIFEPDILDLYPVVPTLDLLQQFSPRRIKRLIEFGFQTPRNFLFNVDAAKKLPRGFSANLTFNYAKTLGQTLTRNINAPLAGTFDPQNLSGASYPLGNIGNVYEIRSAGTNENFRLAVTVNFPEKILSGNVRYSFTRSLDNTTNGSGSPFDPYDFSREFASTPFDGVHVLGGYISRQLPFKLTFESDFSISSGTRFNIITGRDTNGDGFFEERPAFADDPNKPGVIFTRYGLLDPNPADASRLIPRNLVRGPVRISFNSFLTKTFGFGEDKKNKKPPKRTLRLSLRVYNVFNIVNRTTPGGNMSSPNFLRSLSGAALDTVQIINGIRVNNFAGRSLNLSVGFSF